MTEYQFPVKDWYLVLEMLYSSSSRFSTVIKKLHENFDLKKIVTETGVIVFQIFVNKKNVFQFFDIWDTIKNWKNYTLYICGEEIEEKDFRDLIKCYKESPCQKIVSLFEKNTLAGNCYDIRLQNEESMDYYKFCPLIYGKKYADLFNTLT